MGFEKSRHSNHYLVIAIVTIGHTLDRKITNHKAMLTKYEALEVEKAEDKSEY